MILLVGLGNPGKKYEHTRHNAGRMFVEQWDKANGGTFSFKKPWNAKISNINPPADGQTSNVICLLPETFMNNSGDAISHVARFYKITPQDIWIVMDDLYLDFGVIRTRQAGSDGGHNGLKSTLEKMNTTAIPRIRIGIGSNGIIPAEDYVLQQFTEDELHELQSDVYAKFSSLISRALISGFPTDTIA